MSATPLEIADALMAAADYRGLREIAPLLGLHQDRMIAVRAACDVATRVIELDAEDWGAVKGVPDEIRNAVAAALVPRNPHSPNRGFLGDLRPAYGLLQDVLAIRYLQRDMAGVLAVCHIMSEYLPLLAWQRNLGHAADPPRLAEHVTRPGSRWGIDVDDRRSRDCDHPPSLRGSLRTAVRMGRPDSSWSDEDHRRLWGDYLDRDHSRVASALATCGLKERDGRPSSLRWCDKPCPVWTQAPGDTEALADRLALAGVYIDSELIGLRHAAPVGHGFGVPDRKQLATAWTRTWRKLTDAWPGRRNPLADRPLGEASPAEPLPGMGALIDAVAGSPVARPGFGQMVNARLREVMGNEGMGR